MPLKLLCLHGWGTNIKKILQSQLNGLMTELQRDNTATLHFVEGDVDSIPGPGIAGFYDGPYYSYYKFPRSFSDPDGSEEESMLDAYNLLYDIIDDEGPFDGILGFSHGGTLASGFLIHHAKMFPNEPPLVRCAIFINSLPPFRMNPGENPVVDADLNGYIKIPTVNIAGSKDPLFKYSLALHRLCDPTRSTWVVHSKGHDIPNDKKNVALMSAGIRKLAVEALSIW
ncbi:putative DUF341 family oxidoreductase [Aspergillus clavatus NRRL 1]|uniref:DUF341 domain oxidoreductase, putative n=1 Tax=Aspergillus clavatus (strain ATCC 1007 / CBS 513.65 / DSM 816 / NCTC 3887 / NRRL 1 / QM 1276 / 107) TaxID=344612 RepID=A1CCS8_ASPCL|nr:DUF341 domain oxidoreductase, putative [Aspergillus clavatus NRRL 1]EAW12335.1 DUF341 domain oxidoreductase, putative [Aspergillus clavatus NRRL 1]